MLDSPNQQGDSAVGRPLDVVCVSVGNTNTKYGLYRGRELLDSAVLESARHLEIGEAVATLARKSGIDSLGCAVVLGSVNAVAARAIASRIESILGRAVYRIGVDLPIPLNGRLDHEAMTGHDRALNALAAYEMMHQAVVVVDAGTAITVDFIDGEGVFHGGAIAPGVGISLKALHAYTTGLPEVSLVRPDEHPFGSNTQQAILNGVFFSARGLVRILLERYAEAYGGYPLVLATGGDSELIFGDDEIVDRVVPHLTLLGIAIACERALEEQQ